MNANAKPEVKSRVNLRFRSYSLLTDYFPLTLENGAIVKGIGADCSKCGVRLMPNMFRGEVRETVASCFRVTAIGWCSTCDLLTPYLFHIVPHGDHYDLVPLEFRGWPESYEPSIVIFKSRITPVMIDPPVSNTG